MRRWSRGLVALILPVVVAAAALTSRPAGATTGALDQEQTVVSTQLLAGVDYYNSVAQEFTADRTGLIDQVDVFLAAMSVSPVVVSVSPMTDYVLPGTGEFQVPTGPVLGSGEIPLVWPINVLQWFSVPLSQPAPVVAGQTYALTFSYPQDGYWGGYDMFEGSAPGSGYPVAVRYAGVWYPLNGSVAFRTYIESSQPTLTVPAPITVPATSPAGAVVTYTASAADSAGNPLTVSCSPPSGSTFPIGTTSVTCSATDSSGGTASGSFDVTVQDTDLGLTGMPSDMTVDATSPAGATVSFTPPTASDEDGPGTAAVSCAPASGAALPVGTTSVTCTATDSDDTPSSVSQSFSVTVLSPAAQLTQLGQAVQGLGSGGSLAAKVAQAQAELTAGDVASACATLTAFENEVRAQSGKNLSTGQADQLLASAEAIRGAAGC